MCSHSQNLDDHAQFPPLFDSDFTSNIDQRLDFGDYDCTSSLNFRNRLSYSPAIRQYDTTHYALYDWELRANHLAEPGRVASNSQCQDLDFGMPPAAEVVPSSSSNLSSFNIGPQDPWTSLFASQSSYHLSEDITSMSEQDFEFNPSLSSICFPQTTPLNIAPTGLPPPQAHIAPFASAQPAVPYPAPDLLALAPQSFTPQSFSAANSESSSPSPFTPAAPSPQGQEAKPSRGPRKQRTPIPCPICPSAPTFGRDIDLGRHIHSVHYSSPDDWRCVGIPVPISLSSTPFARSTRMYQGMLMVGGCGRTHSRRDALIRHLRKHEGVCVGDPHAEYLLGNQTREWVKMMVRALRKVVDAAARDSVAAE